MIDRIRGCLLSKSPTRVVVETGGVGFDVAVPLSTYDALPGEGMEITLLVHVSMINEQLKLFGFATEKERTLFRMLISISGVGPSIALAALSGSSPDVIISAVRNRNVGVLSAIKGIGRKRAERIVMELKDGVESLVAEGDTTTDVPVGMDDAVNALVSLGFSRGEALGAVRRVIDGLEGGLPGTEEVVRLALQAGKR